MTLIGNLKQTVRWCWVIGTLIACGVIAPTLAAAARGSSVSGDVADLTPNRLRCEYLANPLGIDEPAPRLSWALNAQTLGQRQSRYQLLVSSSPEKLSADQGDVWDTGQVTSDKTTHIAYEGAKLKSGQRVWWKVRSWDQSGKAGPWSSPAHWEMGLVGPTEWTGEWIGRDEEISHAKPLPLLRKQFNLDSGVRKARAYVCGLGYHELHVNGRRIGDARLAPGYTRYGKRLLYETLDVTDALRKGENAIGVMLGNGWFNVETSAPWGFNRAPWRASPRLSCEIWIEYNDGRLVKVISDSTWKTSPGPITISSIYGGEAYDAQLEQPGWSEPGFDDSSWAMARTLRAPLGRLRAEAMPPIRFTKRLEPVKIVKISDKVRLYDFGQNMSGCVELQASGPAGSDIQMVYSELLGDDQRLDRENIACHVWSHGKDQRFQTDSYRLKGQGREQWVARFTYHGFRYVEVTADKQVLENLELSARFMHTDMKPVGTFECSNDLLNKIWNNGRWSYLSNFLGIPTDCPHREKNGWTGDAHLACEFGLLNYDSAAAYTKWIGDLQDEQRPSGELPGIVPTGGWGYSWGNGPAWDSAYLLVPDYMRLYCGDTRLADRQYEGHRRYVDYLHKKSDDLIVRFGLGDWAPWKTTTPDALTSTAYFYKDTLIVAESVMRRGDSRTAEQYRQLAVRIREAFNREYWSEKNQSYDPATQTSLSCALYQGLVDNERRPLVTDRLVAQVKKTDLHIDTGILGAKYLLAALSDNGQAEAAYRIASQRTQPSWGWWIDQGATTLWEQWTTNDSHNHIMYGDVAAWFVRSLVGLNPDELAPGFANVVVRPHPVGDLTWAKATHESLRGPIEVSWRRAEGALRLEVATPANVTSTVYLPTTDATQITVLGASIEEAKHVQIVETSGGVAELRVGPGRYVFETPFAPAKQSEPQQQ